MMKKTSVDMLNGPIFKGIVVFAVPVMVTSILQLLFNATDLIVIGQFCGSHCVAAIGATNSLVALIVNFFIGLANGVGIVVAQNYGAGNVKNVEKAVHTTIPVAILSGLLITVIGMFFAEDMLELMETPDDIIELSALYLQIYFAGIVLRMLYNFCAAILRAVGDTKSPMLYLTLGGALNVVFNLFFVLAFNMDVDGVAYGTLISEAVSALLVLRALIKRTDCVHFDFKKMRLDGKIIGKIFGIGIPAGIQSCMFSISNVIIQSSVNSFGSTAVSGNAAASSIGNFVASVTSSYQHTASNFIGQNIGAKKFDRARKITYACLICMSISGFAAGGVAAIFSRQLLSIYITDSPESIKYGMMKLLIVTMPYFLCGLMEVITGVLRGMGISTVPMIISVMCVCVFRVVWVCTIFTVPQYHTLKMLYISYPVSWIIAFVAEYIAYVIAMRKKESIARMKEGQRKKQHAAVS